MTCPWFLRVAYFLGLNPYAQIGSLKIVKFSSLLNFAYVIGISVKVVSNLVETGMRSVVIFAVIYRTFVTAYFVIIGIIDIRSTITFYEEILAEIESSTRKKVYIREDVWCLVLLLVVISETIIIIDENPFFTVMFTISSILNTIIPLISMAQFSLCCTAVQSSYLRLQHDLLQSVPRTSAFTLRRIRVRQLDIADRVRDISSIFGLRLLLYIMMIQFILLEKVDFLVYQVASQVCTKDCPMVFMSFLGYYLTLWYFSYRPFKAACEHHGALATLMDLDTKDMDVSAMQEMALLAEALNSRETQFSAAGCFYVGFHIFYSVIGIIFSYIMIIGPLAYNKYKPLWSDDD